jgi:hypothetical protein
MNRDFYNDSTMEQQIKARFGLDVDVKSMIARAIPVGPGARANVFLSTKSLLFAFIVGTGRLTFGDVQKILSRMGLRPELFLPPRGEAHYFDEIGQQKFKEVFPGRQIVKSDDLRFYRTLAPYDPALVQIAEIISGRIKQYDNDAVSHWRTAAKFAYRRIRTS